MYVESRVLLSPSGDVPVCPESHPSVRCSTNFSILEWNVMVFEARTSGQSISINRRVLITSAAETNLRQLTISGQSFIFTRNSALNSNPLISTLTIANVLLDLSTIKVNCTDTGDLLAETSTSVATISIINPHISRYFFTVSFKWKIILVYIQWHHSDRISVAHPDLSDVEMKVLENGMESVLVLLEWSQLPGNATVYTVDMIPLPLNNVAFIQSTIVHLQLSYNMHSV